MSARGGRASLIAVAAGLAILAYITYNTLTTPAGSSSGLAAGTHMPPFAAPLATSDLVGDANVALHPNEGAAGARPACSVVDPRALNSCTLARRGPVMLAFFTQDAGRCLTTLDTLGTLAARDSRVGVAAVAIRGDRGTLRALVRRRGWRFPVAQDRDGAVADLYGVAICPTVVLAYRGGVVMRTALGSGETTAAALARDARALEAGRRRSGGAA